MSALKLLNVYCSDEDSSDEQFIGFDEDPATERFPIAPWWRKKSVDKHHTQLPESSLKPNLEPCKESVAEWQQETIPESPSKLESLTGFRHESLPEPCEESVAEWQQETIPEPPSKLESLTGFRHESLPEPSTSCRDRDGSSDVQNLMDCPDPELDSDSEILDSEGSFFGEEKTSRKRKRTKKEIKKAKTAKARRLSHKVVLTKCGCSKDCNDTISKDERVSIHAHFWNLKSEDQCGFIRENVTRMTVQKRRKNRFADDNPKKFYAHIFKVRLENGESRQVCKKFFLNTIGYNENCGNIVYRCFNEDFDGNVKPSQRGKYKRSSAKREAVKSHILSYNPNVSHYRRQHAPNRLYLPSDLTEIAMHKNYQDSTSSDLNVSYPFYSSVMSQMHISLVKLGHEECETCVSVLHHQKQTGHSEAGCSITSCSICDSHAEHMRLATLSRSEYRNDGDQVRSNEAILAVDLQKVIQLPRLDGLKSIVFSQRILAYNETFAPVGGYSSAFPVIACVWDETTAGRSSSNITSCFHKVIMRCKDMEKLTFWLDNCASQNKNWNFFLHLILLINSEKVHVKELTLNFFESGHTFMAADSFHAAVEKSMRHGQPASTFPDFRNVVQRAKKNVEVMNMEAADFFEMKLTVSPYILNKCKPRPYIDNIRKVIFRKGSFEMLYSSSVDESERLLSCNIISNKQRKIIFSDNFTVESVMTHQKGPVGINADRKRALLTSILPVVPDDQKEYWNNLPERKETSE